MTRIENEPGNIGPRPGGDPPAVAIRPTRKEPCQAIGRTYLAVADLLLASDGVSNACTKRNILPQGMAGTGVRCLAAWTPSKNMSINAIRITTTAMIDKTDAPALPRSRIPEKAR
jgi:hypothetical protein